MDTDVIEIRDSDEDLATIPRSSHFSNNLNRVARLNVQKPKRTESCIVISDDDESSEVTELTNCFNTKSVCQVSSSLSPTNVLRLRITTRPGVYFESNKVELNSKLVLPPLINDEVAIAAAASTKATVDITSATTVSTSAAAAALTVIQQNDQQFSNSIDYPDSAITVTSRQRNAARKRTTKSIAKNILHSSVSKAKETQRKKKKKKIQPQEQMLANLSNVLAKKSNGRSDFLSVKEYYLSQEPSTAYYDDRSTFVRFRCNICSKHFKNNILATNHLFHHLRPDHNSIASTIKCLNCLANFTSFHKLQVHQLWHRNNALLNPDERNFCQICEIEFSDTLTFAYHLKDSHPPHDMPYVCGLCFYRTSIYSDVLVHFNEAHRGTVHMLCQYCLRTFKLHQSPSTFVCMLNVFFNHLKKHVTAKSVLCCSRCRLIFLTDSDLKRHEETDHQGVPFLKDGLMGLNVMTIGDNKTDLRELKLDECAKNELCLHCGEPFGRPSHFVQYRLCKEDCCRFATCCRRSMCRHIRAYHREPKPNQLPPRRAPVDRPLPYYMHCHCSFKTILGNAMAKHLETCLEGRLRPTAKLLERPSLNNLAAEIGASLHKLEPSGIDILDAVGLMKIVAVSPTPVVNDETSATALQHNCTTTASIPLLTMTSCQDDVMILKEEFLLNDADEADDCSIVKPMKGSKWNKAIIEKEIPHSGDLLWRRNKKFNFVFNGGSDHTSNGYVHL